MNAGSNPANYSKTKTINMNNKIIEINELEGQLKELRRFENIYQESEQTKNLRAVRKLILKYSTKLLELKTSNLLSIVTDKNKQ